MSTLTAHGATTAPGEPWEPFRVLLRTQRDACLRQRELALAETVASHPDLVATTRAATLLGRIDQIDAALRRIEAGTYGTCVRCGGAIPVERLEFRPCAVSCATCPPRRR